MPEEIPPKELVNLITARYNANRHTIYSDRIINAEKFRDFDRALNGYTKGMHIEGKDGGTFWIYRKPTSIKDEILKFEVLPQERVSLSVKADPQIIKALDAYVSKGEVIKNGEVIKTVKQPKAYYKSLNADGFNGQTEPITIYFREPVTKEHLNDLKIITENFKSNEIIKDPLFLSGQVADAGWMSSVKENTPEDAYKIFKIAQKYDHKLAEAVAKEVKSGVRIGENRHVVAGYDEIAQMENFRYRISAGLHFAIESVVKDYLKACGIDIARFSAIG